MNNITASILIVASLTLFFGYINPAYQRETVGTEMHEKSIKELTLERAEYREALEKTREIELARTGLLEKYNSISEEDKERLSKLLPDHIDSVRLIIDINNIAAQYGMTLKNINMTDADKGGSESGSIGPAQALFSKVGFEFSLSGSYDTFRSFLHDLEQSLRLIDVTAVSFAAGKEEAYDFKVTITTYRLK